MNRPCQVVVAVVVSLACTGAAGCGTERDERDPESKAVAPSPADFRVAVDRRVELMSMLFRLAGVPPYGQSTTPYAVAADGHFAPFRRHPAVVATRELAARHGISHEAPAELAAYLDGSMHPIRALSPLPPGLDPRWRKADVDGYLREVRRFAADSRFDAFHRSQSAYQRAVAQAFRAYLAGKSVVGWFDAVFGRRRGASYTIVPGLLTGEFSFSTRARQRDGDEDIALIMFLEGPDRGGVPHPTASSLEYIAHELAHSYVNPIFDARVKRMRASALPLFRRVERAMRAQAYNSYPILVNESVVRALVVLFLRERATAATADRSLAEQRERSFLWTPELVEALDAQRRRNGGRLKPAGLISTVRRVFTDWHGR